jgi:hypothetical protein
MACGMSCPLRSDDNNLYLILDVEGGAAEAVCTQGAKWTVQVQCKRLLPLLSAQILTKR